MPSLTPRAQAEADARREREAAALRENLRRRKAQVRSRDTDPAMPTLLRWNGFRVYFCNRETDEPPHVHVDRAGASAKVWLRPVTLASNAGYPAHELADVLNVVRDNEPGLSEAWREFFDPAGRG